VNKIVFCYKMDIILKIIMDSSKNYKKIQALEFNMRMMSNGYKVSIHFFKLILTDLSNSFYLSK
jgi:hypothetical protein